MRDYDPWVFGLMAAADHKEALRDVAQAQLARQAMASRVTPPSTVGAHREGRYVQHLLSSFTAYARLLFYRQESVPPWSAWVWPG